MQRASRGMTARISTRTATGGKGNGHLNMSAPAIYDILIWQETPNPTPGDNFAKWNCNNANLACRSFLSKDFQSKFPDIFSRIFFLYFHVVLFFFQILKCEAFQIFCPLLNFQTLEMFPVFSIFSCFSWKKKWKIWKNVAR